VLREASAKAKGDQTPLKRLRDSRYPPFERFHLRQFSQKAWATPFNMNSGTDNGLTKSPGAIRATRGSGGKTQGKTD